MTSNYEKLIRQNLSELYANLPGDLEDRLGAEKRLNGFRFRAFGRDCTLGPEGVAFSEVRSTGPEGLLVSLYALRAAKDPLVLEPFKAFSDFPGSMPYQGAFKANSERVLSPYVPLLKERLKQIENAFGGERGPLSLGGDFSFLLYPLPKVALCYICYLPDEEFPASVTCLFSSNALSFMPLDGLADTAEYASKRIVEIIMGSKL